MKKIIMSLKKFMGFWVVFDESGRNLGYIVAKKIDARMKASEGESILPMPQYVKKHLGGKKKALAEFRIHHCPEGISWIQPRD